MKFVLGTTLFGSEPKESKESKESNKPTNENPKSKEQISKEQLDDDFTASYSFTYSYNGRNI